MTTRTAARFGIAALVACIGLVAGCSNGGRVESSSASAKAEGTCNDGKTCEKGAGCCNASASEKATCPAGGAATKSN